MINKEAKKLLKLWAQQDFYVYIRSMSSVYVDPKKEPRLYFTVSVEYRGVKWEQITGEGYDLSKIIITMSGRVPNRHAEQPGYKPGKETGWLAAKAVAEKQLSEMRAARGKKTKKAKKKLTKKKAIEKAVKQAKKQQKKAS